MTTTTVVAFLVLLPFATSLLGSLLGLLDGGDRAGALSRAAVRGLVFVAAGALLGRAVVIPALAALLAALALHAGTFALVRTATRRGWLTRAAIDTREPDPGGSSE